jgi:hypothetical protein
VGRATERVFYSSKFGEHRHQMKWNSLDSFINSRMLQVRYRILALEHMIHTHLSHLADTAEFHYLTEDAICIAQKIDKSHKLTGFPVIKASYKISAFL